MEQVVESQNLRTAYRRVKANAGAPGIDRMTVEELRAHLSAHWAEIKVQLLNGTYQPQAVRRVEDSQVLKLIRAYLRAGAAGAGGLPADRQNRSPAAASATSTSSGNNHRSDRFIRLSRRRGARVRRWRRHAARPEPVAHAGR